MDLFKWVGRKKREEGWMAQPRRIPDFAKDISDDAERWLVTQEFVNDEDKNLRVYLAIHQPDPKVEKWVIYHVDYNLKHDGYVNANWSGESNDPMEIVRLLRDYERKFKRNAEYISHPEQRANYRGFANKYGIHFDDDGNVFRVMTEAPLLKGTFMNRESLDKIFHNASKQVPLDSWDGIYKGIVDVISPDWTVTEKAFGLQEKMQDAKATPADTQFEATNVQIVPMATHVSEIAAQPGGVIVWKGDASSMPTAKEIQEARDKAAKPAIEPAKDGTSVPATVPGAEPAAEKPPEPPPPVKVNGKTVYEHARAKTWGGYKEMQQLNWQRPVTVEDLPNSKNYPEYAYYMRAMMETLNKLPAALTDKSTDMYAKEAKLREVSRYAVAIPFRSGRRGLAKHLCDATLLVGMLRAGAAVYKDQFGPGKKFTPEGLQLISNIGKICTQFAIDRLGVDPEAAKKIPDVIARGADTFGPDFPLEKIFAKHPAADFKPAPPSSSPHVAATSKKPVKKKPQAQRGYWD